jgi:hypothetical protein
MDHLTNLVKILAKQLQHLIILVFKLRIEKHQITHQNMFQQKTQAIKLIQLILFL